MDGMVTLGSWVTVRDGALEEAWRIVPHLEADAIRHHISEASPLARAVLGHRPGDTVRVMGPERRPVTILSIGIEWRER
jgi:transcription elongation factor GreA